MRTARPALLSMLGIVALAPACRDRSNAPLTPPAIPSPADLHLVKEDRLVQAVKAARDAVAASPASATAWGKLGHLYMIHGWKQHAAPCYRRAAEIEPNEFAWHYHLGRSLAAADQAAAAQAFADAIALNPDYSPAHTHRGRALKRLGRREEAERHFQRAAELDDTNPLAQVGLGQLALAAKQYQDAEDYFLLALARNRGQVEAHAGLVRVYRATGDPAAAARHLGPARKRVGSNPMRDPLAEEVEQAGVTAHWFARRGLKYLVRRDYARAAAELAEAVAIQQSDPAVWLNYGVALYQLDRNEEAIQALEKALAAARAQGRGMKKIPPKVMYTIHQNTGLAYKAGGNAKSAEESFRQALAVVPRSADTAYHFALLLRSQGRSPEAMDVLRRAGTAQPDRRILGLRVELLKETGDYKRAQAVQRQLRQLGAPAGPEASQR